MATKKQNETNGTTAKRRPTHRVTFQQKTKKGYGPTVELGGGWANSKGGINFPFAGGSITVWPVERREEGAA